MNKKKLIRTSTVPISLDVFCRGQLKWLSDEYEVVAVSSPHVELEVVAKREGVRTIAVPMERRISVLKDFVSLLRMIIVFAREKPYIVHSITPKAGLISMLAAKLTRVPVRIHTFTGLVFPTSTGIKQKVLMFMDRLICWCATFVNPEGEGVRRDLIDYRITKKPLHIIANGNVRGVDMNYYDRTKEVMVQAESIRKDAFTFIFVGRLVREKGINELVAAFAKLHGKHANTRLLLLGVMEDKYDPLKSDVVQLINTHPSIDFVGRQSDVRPYLAASDVLVFPSYREGFPNVVLEAGAMGLPSIVTDINGSNEIISEGLNGSVVPVRDGDALYEAMKRFYDCKCDELMRMSLNARKNVAEKYDFHLIWSELRATYGKLAGCSGRNSSSLGRKK